MPAVVSHKLCQLVVIGAWSLSINAEINRGGSAQAFAPAKINLPSRKLRLRHCLIAPVVPRCHQCPVSLAKALVFEVRINASSVNK